jgi:hypothetical protein
VNRLLAQLRENTRLRVLLALVVFVVAFVKVLDARDAVAERRLDAQRAETELARWSAIAQEGGWAERVEQARSRRQAADALLWAGTTPSQAQLAVQEWLTAQMKTARLGAVRVTGSVQPKGMANQAGEPVTGTSALPADVIPLRLGVSFELTPDSVERFAGLLEASGKAFVIDTMNARRQPLPRVELELVTLARIAPRTAESSSPATAGEKR